jgi:hypothetical protein
LNFRGVTFVDLTLLHYLWWEKVSKIFITLKIMKLFTTLFNRQVLFVILLFLAASSPGVIMASPHADKGAASQETQGTLETVEITIGDGDFIPPFRIPLDFYYRSSLNQTIYFDHEMDNTTGLITGLTLYTTFVSNLPQRHVEFYMATTTNTSIPSGFLPGNIFTKVFDGKVDFPSGEHAIFIPLQQPFYYDGDNLVVMAHRVYNQYIHNQEDKFFSTTNLAYWDRSRQSPSNSVTYDPMNPPTGGTGRPSAANATFHIYTGPLGGVLGLVKDSNGSPLPGATVEIRGTTFEQETGSDGTFSFAHLPEGSHILDINLSGFLPKNVPFQIIEGETLSLDITLTELALVNVSGMIEASDNPGQGLEGALVTLEGYSTFEATTATDGTFLIDNVFGFNNYKVSITHPDYFTHQSQVALDDNDLDLGTILLTERTYHVSNVLAEEVGGGALVSWEPPAPVDAFRYDDGVAHSQLGFNFGTLKSVLGAAHYRQAEIHQIRWYLTSNTQHSHVKLWVIGLDENGVPDRNNIIITYEDVPNIQHQWNTFELPESLYLPNGFFLGVSADGFLGLANDNGAGPPYEYIPGVQFGTYNIEDPLFPFTDVSEWGMESNFLLRAYGYDFGPAETTNLLTEEKALETFSVFRLLEGQEDDPDAWDEMAGSVTGYDYLDENWQQLPPAVYRYAVIAEYTSQVFSRPVFSNLLANNMLVPFTVNITTNSGDSPEGAIVLLEGGDEVYHFEYEMEAPASGTVVFPEVWRGIYNVSVILEGFLPFDLSGADITGDSQSIDVHLVEDIADPYGLLVETEDLDAGQALFSWNNFFGYPEFFDGFESGDLSAWGKFIQGPGTPGSHGYAYWHATDDVDGNNPPEGSFVGKVNWGYDIDTWLVTPLLHIQEETQLVFSWFSSYFWSVDPNPNAELMVKISHDDGETWTQLWNWQQIGEWETFTWHESVIDLGEFEGQSVLVAFHLEANNNAVTQIDNIIISQGRKAGTRVISLPLAASKDAREAPVGSLSQKALLGYNIFLDDLTQPVATLVQEQEYLFEQLPEGAYLAGVQAEYTTGSSAITTIPFIIEDGYVPEKYQVTFNVHMHAADFDPETDVIFITGDMTEWAAPGDAVDQQTMQPTDDEFIYTITFELEAGDYEYKFFMNAGWEGGEWDGDPNRMVTVEGDIVVDNVFGDETDQSLSAAPLQANDIRVYPNPASGQVHIHAVGKIAEVNLYSLEGRLVGRWAVGTTQESISLSGTGPGIYLLQVITTQGVHTERLQIAR